MSATVLSRRAEAGEAAGAAVAGVPMLEATPTARAALPHAWLSRPSW